MSADDILNLVIRSTFLLLSGLTLIGFLRRPNQARLDIALMFNSVGLSFVISILRSVGIHADWLSLVSTLALIAQPYLLLRLAQYFRAVPVLIQRLALFGLIASWLILGVTAAPVRALPLLVVAIYFVGVEGFAAVAFARGALTTGGVARFR